MPAPTTDNSIIARIQKLLSLANSPNEAEAALAMARAQELLAKHNLDFALVQDTYVAGGTKDAPEEKREKTKVTNRSAKYHWQRELWATLCESNFCWHWIVDIFAVNCTHGHQSRVRVKRHMILGRESNVIAVRLMGEYLEDTMERMLPYANSERHSRSAISWKRGVAHRLIERLIAEAERRKKESDKNAAGTTAVALRSVYDREHEMNHDAIYGKGHYRQKQIQDAEWEAGQEERERRAEEARVVAEKKWLEYLKNESPEQKKEREREEAKELRREERNWNRRSARSWGRERRDESANIDASAYSAGKEAGAKINLSAQVGKGTAAKRKELA